MIGFRISRDGEFNYNNPRKLRLYGQEIAELVSILNDVSSTETEQLLGDLGPSAYRRRERTGASMGRATENLMSIIRTDLCRQAETGVLERAIASSIKIDRGPLLDASVREYVFGNSAGQRRPWLSFISELKISSAVAEMRGKHTALDPVTKATAEGLAHVLRLMASSEGLAESVIRNRNKLKTSESEAFFREQRGVLESLRNDNRFSEEYLTQELEALDILEEHSAAVDLFLNSIETQADQAIEVCMRVFDSWINWRLKREGLSFRLILDRTSSYRLVPPEACSRLDDPNSVQPRLIRPMTVLGACFISYLTLPGINSRVQEWAEAVDLVDRLALFDGLTRLLRCRVCARWMYAYNERRDYCGDTCRYKLWAKTPRGMEKRRKASAAWRRKFAEELRRAAPKVRPGQRNH